MRSALCLLIGLVLHAHAADAPRYSAEERAFWAFQPIRQPSTPALKNAAGAANEIDAFVLARLESKGLKPAPVADRTTLIRRVTFDLTGLPPTPEEVEALLTDSRPDAWERVVERLLASPHYGERWGRHWLDVARYAETTANDANAVMRYAWRYRDYVVGAFNSDMPYDQFVIEQLAGDLLPGGGDDQRRLRQVTASGFLMVGPKALAETDKEQTLLDVVDEQIDATTRAFLGLTVSCARCHDHKFDPISTRDYYALAGIFRSTDHLMDLNRNASMWWEYEAPGGPGGKPVVVMAPKDGKSVDLAIHRRGNRFTLGKVAPRGFPEILAGEKQPPIAGGSGRPELARWVASKGNPLTARVIVNRVWQHHFGTGLVATSDNFGKRGELPSHPELLDWLAARFIADGWSIKTLHRRVLLSNTYRMACIDDAAAAKADSDNRLIWRMPRRRLEAEAIRDAMLAVCGRLDRKIGGGESSEYLWEKAENINAKIKPNRLKSDDSYYVQSTRRSLYLPVVRNMLPDILAPFDAADPNAVTAIRNDTTVPSQALFLMNHPFVREQALHFARSLLAEPGDDRDRIRRAVLRSWGRPPTGGEAIEANQFLGAYVARARQLGRSDADARLAAWQSYCQTLLSANEFLYIE